MSEFSGFGKITHTTWGLFGPLEPAPVFAFYQAIGTTAPSHHILLLIDSPGGCVSLTQGLMQSIMRKFPVFETRNVGEAASASVHLMLAGSLRTALEPTTFFTHPMYSEGAVRSHSAKSFAKVLQKQDEWVAELFAARTKKKDPDFWVDFFSKDRFFDAKEAKRLGIIHEIL